MPATVDLTEMLRADDIHFGFRAASTIEAIPLLLQPALARRIGDRAVIDSVIAAAIRREEDTSTRCGPLALPHARTAAVPEFILALGVNPAGVIAGQAEPRLMFAFVSPEQRREEHLRLLASLARLSQNAWIVEKICSASNAGEVLEILRGAGV